MSFPKIIEKDKKLLSKLYKDGRASHKQLGKAMRASAETARYRLNRLKEKNVLDSVIPIIDINSLGYTTYRIQIRYEPQKISRIKELKQECEEIDETSWIVDLSGDWDFVVLFQVKKISRFNEIYQNLTFNFGDVIREKKLTIVTRISHLAPTYLTERDGPTYETGLRKDSTDISEIQYDILEILLEDGRQKYSKIGKRLDVSISTVRYHVNELEDDGVVKGYKPVINAETLGYDHYKIVFELANPSQKQSVRHIFEKEDNITYITESLGTYDIECEGFYQSARDVISMIETIKERIKILDFTIIYNNDEYLINALPR